MFPKLLSAASLFLFTTARLLLGQEATTHTKDSLQAVKGNVQTGKALIVDVREQGEWDAGHLQGAILLPQSKLRVEGQLAELLKVLPKDKIIYTHCKAGGRALTCGDILKKQGYDVRPLKAGYETLLEAGFPKDERKP